MPAPLPTRLVTWSFWRYHDLSLQTTGRTVYGKAQGRCAVEARLSSLCHGSRGHPLYRRRLSWQSEPLVRACKSEMRATTPKLSIACTRVAIIPYVAAL